MPGQAAWPAQPGHPDFGLERLKLRSVSAFEHLSEEAIESGFARIEAALPSLAGGPQYETSELLVFQR